MEKVYVLREYLQIVGRREVTSIIAVYADEQRARDEAQKLNEEERPRDEVRIVDVVPAQFIK